MFRQFILVSFAFFLLVSRVRADVGVVLNESLDTSVARITGSGHSAVYLSRICPASPVKMRLCGPHEEGSVLSNYTTLGENQPFQWNIAPLSVYLYGVTDPQDRPLFASQKIKSLLEENYRDKALRDYCDGPPCTVSKNAEWREMVGASTSRSIYILVVRTTVQQDEEIIARFNSLPNQNHFNAFTRNCANFTRDTVNAYFPHATRGDYINDFGMTSPKAIARSFARYAHRHPDDQYRVLHFGQIPGTIKRSTVTRDGTEQLYHSKKLLVPMVLFASHELPFVAASYIFTGRFNPETEYEKFPTTDATELNDEIKWQKSAANTAFIEELGSRQQDEKAEFTGTVAEWAQYHRDFNAIVAESKREEILPENQSPGNLLKALDEESTPVLDDKGHLWLQIEDRAQMSKVGLSPSDILASGSDVRLAFQIMVGHVDSELKSPSHSREPMPEFRENWLLLQQAFSTLQNSADIQQVPKKGN